MISKLFKVICFSLLLFASHSNSFFVMAQTSEDIYEFLKQGQICYELGDLSGAALEFENILLIDRMNFSARVWLAQVYIDLKAIDKARAILREAALQAPEHPKVAQLQQLLGGIKNSISLLDIDPTRTEAINRIGSNTKVRKYGLVIPEEKISPDIAEDLLIFEDIELEEYDSFKIEEEHSELALSNYFKKEKGSFAEVFRILEADGLNPALDKYFSMVFKDPALSGVNDKGLLEKGRNTFSKKFADESDKLENRFYLGAIEYMEGAYDSAEKILSPMRDNPGVYGSRLSPFFAGLDKWNEQKEYEIMLAKKAEEDRIAKEEERVRLEREKEKRQESDKVGADSNAMVKGTNSYQPIFKEGYDMYKRGKLDEAIEKYVEAISKHGEDANLNYHLGIAYTDQGLAGDHAAFDRAIEVFQRAMSLDPNGKFGKDARIMIKDIGEAKKAYGE